MSGGVASPILIDRVDQLARLEALYADVVEGRPRPVLLAGEAGIGKTRLLRELTGRVATNGGRTLVGACLALGDGTIPYLPLAEILRRLARTLDPSALEAALGAGRADLARLVPDVAADGAALPSDLAEPAAGVARARLFEAFLTLIGRLSDEHPTLLAIEDVHWSDPATRDLITFLVRNLTSERVLLVLTLRSDGLAPDDPAVRWLGELARDPRFERIDLDRLAIDDVHAQVGAILGGPPPAGLLQPVWERSEGNPFFVEELVAARLARAHGELPETLVDALLARLLDVPPAVRGVLEALAVLVRPADDRLLATILDCPEAEAASSLRIALDRHLIRLDDRGRVRFRHVLMREVMTGRLLPSERRRLHERIATVLAADASLLGDDAAGVAAELARHWAAADRPAEAYHASIEAAVAAGRVYAHADAAEHYRRALELAERLPPDERPDPATRLDLLRRAADAEDLAGNLPAALALTERALELIDPAAEPVAAGILRSRLGYLHWATGDSEAALAEHREAVRLVPAEPPTAERARVLGALGGALMGVGRWAESRAICEPAVACAVAAGARAEESRARNQLGVDLVALGEVDTGLEELRRARDIAEETGPPDLLIVARSNLALMLVQADRLAEALEEVERGVATTREAGLERRFGMDLAALRADILVRLGRWREADDVTSDALRLDPHATGTTYLATVRGRLEALRGDPAGRERVEAIERDGIDPDLAAFLAAVRAEAALATGRAREAHAAATEGLGVFDGSDEVLWVAPLLALALRSLAELAEDARARRDAAGLGALGRDAEPLRARAAVLAERVVSTSSRAWAAAAGLEAERLSGTATASAWQALAETWDAIPDPLEAAYARFRAAEALLRAEGVRADVGPMLRAAHAAADRLGAAPLRGSIERLAGRARVDLAAAGADTIATPAEREARPAPAPARDTLGLSARELEVLSLVAAGRSNGEIAEALFITRKTASAHVTHILDKLGVSNRVEAAMVAARMGLLDEVDVPGSPTL